ncbi:MAG: cupin domain-containing protein [Solirubrobacterales bacterium]|nr:cupin domain-containing protein [Solirubrobacterales bacterium]
MGDTYELVDAVFKEVERQETQGVEIHVLVPAHEGGRTQVSVTRIAPGGRYDIHVDEYAQVFCVLDGQGEAEVGGERTRLEPGVILRTNVGDPHGLWAAADRSLVVLTVNTYPEG